MGKQYPCAAVLVAGRFTPPKRKQYIHNSGNRQTENNRLPLYRIVYGVENKPNHVQKSQVSPWNAGYIPCTVHDNEKRRQQLAVNYSLLLTLFSCGLSQFLEIASSSSQGIGCGLQRKRTEIFCKTSKKWHLLWDKASHLNLNEMACIKSQNMLTNETSHVFWCIEYLLLIPYFVLRNQHSMWDVVNITPVAYKGRRVGTAAPYIRLSYILKTGIQTKQLVSKDYYENGKWLSKYKTLAQTPPTKLTPKHQADRSSQPTSVSHL